MPVYGYKAVSKDGAEKKGTVEAKSIEAARTMLKDSGLYLLELGENSLLHKDVKIFSKKSDVKAKDVAIFCRQFHSIISAGVNVVMALNLLSEQTENKVLKSTILDLKTSVEKGESLANSMKHHPKVFPNLLIHMIAAGEVSGNLDIALERMADHFENEAKLKQTIKKAFTYPIVVASVSIIVIIVLMLFVVPTFVSMFATIDMELPATTRALIAISDFCIDKWYILVLVIAGITGGCMYYFKTDKGSLTLSRLALKVPLFGKLNVKIAASRFTRTMSTLLASGISLLDALEMVSNVVGNRVIKDHLLDAREQVSRGVPLSTPLKDEGIFPPMVTHMTKIGEDTGAIESMMNKVADFYDEEVESSVQQLMSMLEPLIICVLAIVVGFVVISIVQPMFEMYDGISGM